ncbi:MAG: universal stress protein [Acidobacteriota bacterium]|nr:universal stress protein [Acidobacteriota bacterium]
MKILIPYDGSDSARAALDDLPRAGLPDEAEALILVTHVWLASSPTEFSRAVARRRVLAAEGSSFTPALRDEEEARALAREARRRLRALFPTWRVSAQAAGGVGSPASELARVAVSWGADLIVVGSGPRSILEAAPGATNLSALLPAR